MIGNRFQEWGYKILSKFPRSVRNPLVKFAVNYSKYKAFRRGAPKNISFYITNKCNFRCSHCFYASEINTKTVELSLPQIQKLALSIPPLDTIMISGGEPMLREDILQICNVFYMLNGTRRISIATNGFFTKKIINLAESLSETNPKKVLHFQISIDGTESIHDRLRGMETSFRKAMGTLNDLTKLKHKNLDISVGTIITAENYGVVLELAKLISKKFPDVLHKFGVFRGSHLGTYGVPADVQSDLDGKATAKSPEELEKLFVQIEKTISKNYDVIAQNFQRNKWREVITMLKEKKKKWNCTAGYTFAVIYPNGSVSICEVIKPFAKLSDFDFNFKKLWEKRVKDYGCYCIHPCNILDSIQYDSKQVINTMEQTR